MGRLSHIVRRLHWFPLVNLPVMFPVTLRHHYAFGSVMNLFKNGELTSPQSWDALRTQHPHFVIADDREEWIASLDHMKDGQDPALKDRAIEICELLRTKGMADLHSIGVGGGALEYFIKRCDSSRRLSASDYNPIGVARLRKVFTECDRVEQFDITRDPWSMIQPNPEISAVLMYRVDPHFTDMEWKSIFSKMASERVRHILYIPATEISFQYLAFTLLKTVIAKISGAGVSFTGYARSAKVFPLLWRGLYAHETLRLGGLNAYWLTLTKPNY